MSAHEDEFPAISEFDRQPGKAGAAMREISAPTIEAANGVAPESQRKTLRDLAAKLTPNPALTIDGTLQIILSGIDNIADEDLARSLACANASVLAGGQLPPLTDEQWKAGGIDEKLMLIRAAKSLKQALRLMAE